jgi:TIR domain
VFISYRRRDGHCAGRIAEHLTKAFGNGSVFRDLEAIRGGSDWHHGILTSIVDSDVFLILIGTDWVGSAGRNRLHEPEDTLRQEIEHALQHRVPILPVLVDESELPGAIDMPGSISSILKLQCERVRDSDFKADMERLQNTLQSFEGRRSYAIPVPKQGEPITAAHLALINSSWRSPQHDQKYQGNAVYRFDVILWGDSTVLDRVERVIYLLPEAWKNSPISTENRSTLFGHKDLAWSDVLVRAHVEVKDQGGPIYLSSYVRLTEQGRHLIPR